jgi:hypothetical protein
MKVAMWNLELVLVLHLKPVPKTRGYVDVKNPQKVYNIIFIIELEYLFGLPGYPLEYNCVKYHNVLVFLS